MGIRSLIPNSMPLESGQKISLKGLDRWHNLGNGVSTENVRDNGLLDLMLNEENNPLIILEGKKRQRVVEDSTTNFRNSWKGILLVVTASFVEQSSQML